MTTKSDNTRRTLEDHERWLLKQKRDLYDHAAAKRNDIASGRHKLLNSLLLPFIGDRIRENNRRMRRVQNTLKEADRK